MENKKIITTVFSGDAAYSRHAYLDFVGDKVVFDNSDEEYGPIEFDINLLVDALELHAKRCLEENDNLIKSKLQ